MVTCPMTSFDTIYALIMCESPTFKHQPQDVDVYGVPTARLWSKTYHGTTYALKRRQHVHAPSSLDRHCVQVRSFLFLASLKGKLSVSLGLMHCCKWGFEKLHDNVLMICLVYLYIFNSQYYWPCTQITEIFLKIFLIYLFLTIFCAIKI